MQAVMFDAFGATPRLATVPEPDPPAHGVVVEVAATGVCRSDWHGWMGHDPTVALPHVPGHELAGTVVATGANVVRWRVGDRVSVPFAGGCGACPECRAGHAQVCHAPFQPGFTHWGSFAERVAIHHADLNLVSVPESLDFAAAASLGCRFATAFRAVVDQGRTRAGEWVAVHGCGGVGLAAVMIANAVGARVVAIDIEEERLALAESLGAVARVDARAVPDVAEAVIELTGGGAHVSLDALGHPLTCLASIMNLGRRGRHVQVGLMAPEHDATPLPISRVVGHELEILGSHGMQAHRYDAMMAMIEAGRLDPSRLIGERIALSASIDALTRMDEFRAVGITVITELGTGRG